MRIISGPIWLAPFPEIIDKLRSAMKDNSTDVSGKELWPQREPAVVHFERLIRQLEAQGYTNAEIEGGLQQIVHDEFKGK
jgi:hypothetical protein